MSRGLTNDMKSATTAGTTYPILFWYGDFVSGAVRVCTHGRDVSFDSHTWTGLGTMIGMSEIRESKGVRANAVAFELNGVPPEKVALALASGFRRRPCVLYVGFFTSGGTLISTPTSYRFIMDRMPIRDAGDDSRITVHAEGRLADLMRARERRLTHENQQALFPGDRGLEYVAALQNKEIILGGSKNGSGTAATSQGTAPSSVAAQRLI